MTLPVRDGVLYFKRCAATGEAQPYMYQRCLCCWEDRLESVPASGRATIVTLARYRRTYHPDFPHPHTVAVARLEEGVEIIGMVSEADAGAMNMGDAVRVHLDADGHVMLVPDARLDVCAKT
ncbi:MAG: OB-fold domain-containing protein [Burkholderiaceae bacterium]|nr:OB-fold domain-containing protein [Burkholderiaceae bacterium]MDP1968275.1 OB-fold domain-containing protein [Burkholderiaceae bacterium]